MHYQFKILNLYALPHTVFMCFAFIWEQTATCATYSINWLVFITEMKIVYSAVRTGALNKAVWASSSRVKDYFHLLHVTICSQKYRCLSEIHCLKFQDKEKSIMKMEEKHQVVISLLFIVFFTHAIFNYIFIFQQIALNWYFFINSTLKYLYCLKL